MRIVSVLGGPGSGKGTQCGLLRTTFMCAHLSVGDVLRAEAAKPDSPYTSIIEDNIRNGRVGPKEITVGVLQSHIKEALDNGIQTFFLDGFPRKLDQAEYFEEIVGPIDLVIVFDCPEVMLTQRLLQRSRADDDTDNIKRRIETFKATTSHVVKKYSDMGKVVELKTDTEVEDIFIRLQQLLKEHDMELEPRN
ncbi:hypothetical protein J4E80_004510 [Alternaria sp. BMP 0032]|nr:hypothetical protein J4E80_004510 [Alternaria sp. BMP 0032]